MGRVFPKVSFEKPGPVEVKPLDTSVPKPKPRSYITIGRHEYTDRQKALLQKANLAKEVYRFATVNEPVEVVDKAIELGADAIVIQGLPMHLLAQLLQHAQRANIPVYAFRTEALGLFPNREKAEEAGADIIIPAPEGSVRALRTVALQKLVRVEVVAEDVVSL